MNEITNKPKRAPLCANCGFGTLEMAAIVCAALLIGISIFSMSALKGLQRDKYQHAVDAMMVNDGINICVELNGLVFDAEFGRNSKQLNTDWASTKQKLLDVVGYSLVAAEADDKQRMVETDRALHTFIYSFEHLYSDPASAKDHDELKASLYEKIGKLSDLLRKQESALNKKAREADAAYESQFDAILWLATGIFFLVAWLAFRVIGESREIVRSPESGVWR